MAPVYTHIGGFVSQKDERRVISNMTFGHLFSIYIYRSVSALDDGLEEFGNQNSVTLHFEFFEFPVDYASDLEKEQVRSAAERRRRIWGSNQR